VARGEVPVTVPAQPASDLEANAQFGLEVVGHRRARVTGRNLAGF
jgi:hypothetical protein